ncbi:MAG: LEA type 2 family protein [Blastocatellia bacterium]
MLETTRMVVALLIVAASVTGAGPALAASPADNRKPDVKLKSVALNGVDWGNNAAGAIISVEVNNPGPEFKVKDVTYRLKMNGQVTAEGKYKKEVKVPAASSVTIDLPITVDLSALPAVTWSAITEGLRLSYELDAEFTVPVFAFFNHKVKASLGGELTPGSVMSSLSNRVRGRPGGKP